jgi:hypothetical protein
MSPGPCRSRSGSGAARFHPEAGGRKEAEGDPHDVMVTTGNGATGPLRALRG